MKNRTIILSQCCFALFVLASCAEFKGNYVPVSQPVTNPHYQAPVRDTNTTIRLPAMSDNIRPLIGTIQFRTGSKVKAMRSSGSSANSCCGPVFYTQLLKYTVKEDTVFFNSCRYIQSGDTLFPLHRGSVFVKELKK